MTDKCSCFKKLVLSHCPEFRQHVSVSTELTGILCNQMLKIDLSLRSKNLNKKDKYFTSLKSLQKGKVEGDSFIQTDSVRNK